MTTCLLLNIQGFRYFLCYWRPLISNYGLTFDARATIHRQINSQLFEDFGVLEINVTSVGRACFFSRRCEENMFARPSPRHYAQQKLFPKGWSLSVNIVHHFIYIISYKVYSCQNDMINKEFVKELLFFFSVKYM